MQKIAIDAEDGASIGDISVRVGAKSRIDGEMAGKRRGKK